MLELDEVRPLKVPSLGRLDPWIVSRTFGNCQSLLPASVRTGLCLSRCG